MEPCDFSLETGSAAETQGWGSRLAALLKPGDVLALAGDLGAGKTAFTQGLARGLGITEPVTSPTFTLINQYRTAEGISLQHVDSYRLANAPLEMWDVGLADLFAGDDIVVIEWADRIPGLLPAEHLEIQFAYLSEGWRRLCFKAHGLQYVRMIDRLAGRIP